MIDRTRTAREFARSCVLALTLPLLASAAARQANGSQRLFVIERSLNANVVVYDAVRGGDGRLDPAHPVSAYWLMKADKGQREELSALERMEAYGFDLAGGSRGGVTITLKALKDRPIQVRLAGRRAIAVTRIAGREAVLRRVFVQTRVGHALDVEYVELFGQDARTRKPVHERLKPG